MGFFDFFRRKKDTKKTVDNCKYIESGIKVGQKLFCKNGAIVTVCDIKEKTLIIEYNYKKYERNKSILGTGLFVSKPKNIEKHNIEEKLELQIRQKEENKRQEELELQRKQEEENKRQEELELQRKQEEENKRQEELELQRKQEEKNKCQKELELQRKQEEENKRQEELELQRKQEEENRRQKELEWQRKQKELRIKEKLEIKKKNEKEIKRQELLRLKKMQEIESAVDGFKKNETQLYHDTYGQGVFVDFSSKKEYIYILNSMIK